MPENKKRALRLRSTGPASQGPAASVDASFVWPGLEYARLQESSAWSAASRKMLMENSSTLCVYSLQNASFYFFNQHVTPLVMASIISDGRLAVSLFRAPFSVSFFFLLEVFSFTIFLLSLNKNVQI